MNKIIPISGGLELLIVNRVNHAKAIDGSYFDLQAIDAVNSGVDLQNDVFREQGVSFPEERVLQAADSSGTRKVPGSLDGSSRTYHHLYVRDSMNKFVYGMTVTEEVSVPGLGRIVMHYFPPLVRKPHLKNHSEVRFDEFRRPDDLRLIPETGTASFEAILDLANVHLTRPENEFAARVTDEVGMSGDFCYFSIDVPILVPPMNARTRRDYLTVLPEPVHLWAKHKRDDGNFDAIKLTERQADALIVKHYLVGGYVDTDVVKQLGMKVQDLPCVVSTRHAIKQVASANNGYVPSS
ncbi:hypothetical protein HYU16_02680 [Candidatus Woesearchaeota archaeon]|nr:hypothetical protein [Candidatus Woesearchaeota archaeon]